MRKMLRESREDKRRGGWREQERGRMMKRGGGYINEHKDG